MSAVFLHASSILGYGKTCVVSVSPVMSLGKPLRRVNDPSVLDSPTMYSGKLVSVTSSTVKEVLSSRTACKNASAFAYSR